MEQSELSETGNSEKKAYLNALRLLSRRSYSTHQLTKKLLEKRYDQDVASKVVERVVSEGYIDDEQLIRSLVSKLVCKGKGPYYIAEKLKMYFGLTSQKAFSLIDDLGALASQKKSILTHLSKIDIKTADVSQRRKVYQSLIRKGFEASVIQEIFTLYE